MNPRVAGQASGTTDRTRSARGEACGRVRGSPLRGGKGLGAAVRILAIVTSLLAGPSPAEETPPVAIDGSSGAGSTIGGGSPVGNRAGGVGSAAPSSAGGIGGYTADQIAEMINNPLGYLWLLNVQNTTTWFSGSLIDRAPELGRAQNVTLIQPVLSMQLTPGIRWLSRPIVPVNSFELPSNYTSPTGQFQPPAGGVSFARTTGLGDIQWMNYFATNESVKPPNIFGLGFGLWMDTASREVLGAGKWAAGPAAVAVHIDDTWMYGVIAQQFWSFAGDPKRNDINITGLQPLVRYALTKETGLGVMPNWNYNWETRRWTQLFVGIGVDTMVNLGPVPAQIGLEFHYNLARNDFINPQWQVRLVLTPVVPAPAWAARPLFGH